MLKRIIAAALVLVASFSVGAQWRYEERPDKMTDAVKRRVVSEVVGELGMFMQVRESGHILLFFYQPPDTIWSTALEGTLEVRVDSSEVRSERFSIHSRANPSNSISRSTSHLVLPLGKVTDERASATLGQMFNGKTIKVRFPKFGEGMVFEEVRLVGIKDALMKMTGKPAEWFEQESNKP